MAEDPKSRLGLLPDRPIRNGSEDALGFRAYADVFAVLVNDSETATPMTIAVGGPWGSGKTSLARLIEQQITDPQHWMLQYWHGPPITCWFNAWHHADAPNVGSALAGFVSRTISRHRPWWRRVLQPLPTPMLTPRQQWFHRVWRGVVVASLVITGLLLILLLAPSLRPSLGALGRAWDSPHDLPILFAAVPALVALLRRGLSIGDAVTAFVQDPRAEAASGAMADVSDQMGDLIRTVLGGRGESTDRRLVIFVDDLERCPPDKALEVCEVAKHILSHPGVIVVLIADLTRLTKAAGALYPHDSTHEDAAGDAYLQKLVQLRFTLPPLGQTAVVKLFDRGVEEVEPATPQEATHDEDAWHDSYGMIFLPHNGFTYRVSSLAGITVAAVGALVWFIFYMSIFTEGRVPTIFSWQNITSFVIVIIGLTLTVISQSLRSISTRRAREYALNARTAAVEAIDSGEQQSPELREAILREWWQRQRDEVEAWVRRHLPRNPRNAKRIVNHLRLARLIGHERGIHQEDGHGIGIRHLGKWVVLSEQWPLLGARLTAEPQAMARLEKTTDLDELVDALAEIDTPVTASQELFDLLHADPPLASILGPLSRYERIPDEFTRSA